MDLGKFLRDRKKDVNKRWQNSAVLDAVSSGTQADQARRAQQGPRTINQQASDTYGGGLSAPVNRVRDLFDANTKADTMKRLAATGLSEDYNQEQNRLTELKANTQSDRNLVNQFTGSALRNVGNRILTAPGNFGNVIGAAMNTPILDNIPIVGNISKANKLTGNKLGRNLQDTGNRNNQFIENKINQSEIGSQAGENKWAVSGGQLASDLPMQIATGGIGLAVTGADTASDQYNAARDSGKDSDAALLIGLLQGGATAASEKFGMDRFVPGNGVTGNTIVKASKRFLTEGGQEAQQQFTQNLITNKTYNSDQGLKEGVVESAILGGIAGGVMSPISDISGPRDVKQDVVANNPVLQQTGVPAAPGSIRERIQLAKENVTNKVASNITSLKDNQAGFIAPGKIVNDLGAAFGPANPVVNEKTGETLNQVVEKLRQQKWSEKDISNYVDAVKNPGKYQETVKKNEGKLTDLNPTKTIFADYTPQDRMKIPLGDNITTVDKTLGGSPDDMVTIYRGVDSKYNQSKIEPGDFVTTLPELAESYSGDKTVLSQEVRKGDLLEDNDSPALGEETIYRPNADKETQAKSNKKLKVFDQYKSAKSTRPISGAAQQSQMSKQANNKKIEIYRAGEIDSSRGAFFSNDRDLAGTYSTNPVKGPSGRKVRSYTLDSNTKLKVASGQLKLAKELGINTDKIEMDLLKQSNGGNILPDGRTIKEAVLMKTEDLIKQKLQKEGFDGVEHRGDYYGKPYSEYHIFDTNKSVTKPLDPVVEGALERARVRDYLKNRPVKEGDATTGEGAQLPGEGMSKQEKQSLIQKTKDKLGIKPLGEDGSVKNPFYKEENTVRTTKTTAQERINQIDENLRKADNGSPIALWKQERETLVKQSSKTTKEPKQPISRFSKRAKTSEEISPELQAKIKPVTYEKQTNKKQVETSTKLVNKGYKKAAIEVSARLDAKDSGADAQTVSDAIATIKKLDEKGNPDNHQQASEMFDKLTKRLTEAGQTVQAASLLYNRTPNGLYYSAKRTLSKAGVELTPELDTKLKSLLKDVKATKADSEEGGLARFKFIEQVNKSVPSGRADKAVQLWKAGLLSGPITQAGNITANTFEQGTKRLYEDPIATGVDILMSVFTGKRSKSLTGRGLLSGGKEGVQKGVSYFKTGYDPRNPAQKFDIRNIHYSDTKLGRAAETYTQAIFKSMGTSDQPFYYASMRNSLYDQAITNAKNQGLKGMKRAAYIMQFTTQPDKKALQLADTEARYDVFQNKTKLGEAASGLKGKTGAVGDFIIPFSGVPSSIATRIVERTPLGTATEIVKQMKSGKFDQRKMSQAIARGSTGIVLIGAGKALAAAGLMTLGYPQDDDERKLWQVEGKQAFSIKIGGKWRSLNYFQPAGTLLAAGAAYENAKREGKNETDAWSTAVASTGKAFTEQSFLRGVSGVLNAVTDPKRAGEKFLENTVASAVPNFVRAPTRAADSKQREVNTPLDALKSGIPGQRQSLMVKNNPYGEDLERTSSGWNSLINPTRPSDAKKTDSTTNELRRLQDSGNGIMTATVDKDFLGKDTEKLNDKQINELERFINPTIKSAWDQVVPSEEYKKLSDEDKMKTLRRIKEDVVAVGKREYSAKKQVGVFAQDYKGKDTKLTKSQQALQDGGDFNKYIKATEEDGVESPVTYKEKYEKALKEFNDKDNGYSDIDKISKTKELNKLRIQKDYSEDANDLYRLSKDDIYSYISGSKNGQKLSNELIALDNALYDSGVSKTKKFKNGIVSTSKGKGGRTKKDTSQSQINELTQSTLSRLNSLLSGTQKPVTGQKKVATQKASLKKITVKA